MKKLIMPVVALLLIVQNSYLLAGDYARQAKVAAHANQWEAVYKLIDDGKIDVNERSLGGLPLIARAIELNNLGVVQELLKRGAELNTQVWELPLKTASMRYFSLGDNMPTIELLLQSGADPHFPNTLGVSTLDYVNDHSPWDPAEQATHSARKQELIKLFEQIPPAGIHIKGSEE